MRLVLLFLCFFGGAFSKHIHADIHKNIKLGLSVSAFNKLGYGTKLSLKKQERVLTSFGIVTVDTSTASSYIKLKHPLWRGLQVEYKNNKIQKYCFLSNREIEKVKVQELFSELIEKFGVKFSYDDCKSFSHQGYQLVWLHNGENKVSLKLIQVQENKYNVDLIYESISNKHIEDVFKNNDRAIAFLEPILGKGFHQLNFSRNLVER